MLRFHQTGLKSFFCAAVLAAMVLLSTSTAQAQGLQVFTVSSADDQLRQIDPVTGTTLSSVAITLAGQTVSGGVGLAIDPTNGTAYALLILNATPAAPRELVTLNLTTGVATDVGLADDGTGIRLTDIAFDNAGNMFGISGFGGTGPNSLYTVAKATGVPTFAVTPTVGNFGQALGFDPVGGLLFHATGEGVQNTDEILETVNPAGFAITNVPLSVDDPATEITGLGFWGNGLFLATGRSSGQLHVLSTTGGLRALASLDHDANGIAVTGTPPDCTAAGQICGAAHNGPNGPAVLYSIAQASGAASMVGPIGFERVSGMAFRRSDSVLFATGERMDGTNTSVLLTINPSTGIGTEVGPTTLTAGNNDITDISFRHSDGVLFGVAETNDVIVTLDPATGVGMVIGPHNECGFGNSLAFDFDDTLFHADGDGCFLNTIDQATGNATNVAALAFSPPLDTGDARINAMDFHPITGALFGSVPFVGFPATSTNLATIDKTTAAVTSVGGTQTLLDAIAIAPADADIAVTKDDGATTVAAVNDVITYTITVTNNGPGIASVVQVTDQFTIATATYVAASVTTNVGTCDDSAAAAGTITCDLGAMDPAAVATISFQVTATANGSIVDDVTVTTGTNDPNAANDTAQFVTGVGSADVSVTKVDAVDPVSHPAAIVYTITVTNNALTAAEVAGGVVVTDTLSGAATTVGTAVPSQGTCDQSAFPVITCNLGDIPGAGGFATVAITVNTTAAGTVTDTVSVTTATTDPNTADNTAVETTLVNAIDLVVTKTDSPDPTAVGGGNITYVVTVSNTGNIAATLVALTDNFTGAAVTHVSTTPSAGTCDTTLFPAITCALGTINAGANVTVTIVVTPTAAGTITNTASATATEVDPVPANNTNIAATTTVAATQDFSVAGSPNSQTILPGNSATFTVTVTPLPFVASVALSCSHSIPLGSCSISPSTVNPGNLVATATLTVSTTGFFTVGNTRHTEAPLYAYWLPVTGFGAMGLVLVGLNRKRFRHNKRAWLVALLSLVIMASLIAGCAFGRNREDEGTPGGTYPVTITGTGGSPAVTRTATVNVVVQGSN